MTKPNDSGPSSKPTSGREAGELGLVATPIGNLGDLTPRAADYLKAADSIACEDSRITIRLLQHLGIKKPLLSYHDHNADEMRPRLIERLRRGEKIALVSDAGTPLISDPGFKLVREAAAQGLAVTALPGPSAPIMALILSGLPTDRFLFLGFLAAKSAARRSELEEVAALRASLILFETAPRLVAALGDLRAVLGDRPAAVARELTKMFEEVRRGSLQELLDHYTEAGPPKGEIVIVVGPPLPAAEADAGDLDAALLKALAAMRVKEAAEAVAAASGLPKRQVYQRALELKQAQERDPERGDD
ncbi:16S rRNA (cytidine(1402)-2'-O)-methyltransferase [Dongia sp.]|uniref:16S rRNA (cytidine(1402)-2'-O)-methyltransferase n=1 Tax=Dongia sp. TaxID=1977262 RepID=UPI0035B3F209